MEYSEIVVKISRMSEIKCQQELLKSEWAELEGFFLKRSEDDLADTKNKTVSYYGVDGKVTATMAETVKISWPAFLKPIFGDAYKDAVNEKTTYTLSEPAKRMIGGLWTKNFTKTTVAEIVEELPVDDKAKKLLLKKLKGAKYETDKKNLMLIGGLDEINAEHYAYFVSEAVIWERFCQVMQVNQRDTESSITETLKLIDGAVIVECTPKIAFEAISPS